MVKIKKRSKKPLIILVVLVLFVGAAAGLYIKRQQDNKQPQTTQAQDQNTINLDPPTKEDAKRVDENKQKIVEQDEKNKNTASSNTQTKQTIKPTITYAGQYGSMVEVGAYVAIFEEGGNCTATFTSNGAKVTRTVAAVRGANSVDCPVMSAPASEFSPKGTWSVTVAYTSPGSSGTSDARQIEVK